MHLSSAVVGLMLTRLMIWLFVTARFCRRIRSQSTGSEPNRPVYQMHNWSLDFGESNTGEL